MVAKRKGALVLVPDFSQTDAEETTMGGAAVAPDEDSSSLCAHCGELLAWHETPCTGASAPAAVASEEEITEDDATTGPEQGLAPVPFAYGLGQPVQPAATAQPHTVIWRGQVKERHPHSGLIRRVNVYRLNNGYWDCYYETELRAA